MLVVGTAAARASVTLDYPGRGKPRIRYLWRDERRFAVLPDVRLSDRLTRANVASLCRQLDIPTEDFGLEESD